MKGLRILPYVDAVALGFNPKDLNKAVYSMFSGSDPHAALESPDKHVLDNSLLGDELPVLDAVVMMYGRADGKMKALQRALNTAMGKSGSSITVEGMEVGKPRKSGLTASVSTRFTFSDGQTVTVIFHAPDGDPTQVTSDDMLISYRWMLNGRDVTAWMSPEKDDDKLVDISLATLGMRVSQLIEANSEKFVKRQTSIAADKDALATAKETSISANNQIADLENSKEAAQAEVDKINELTATATAQKEKALTRHKMLTDKLDTLQEAQVVPEAITPENAIRAAWDSETRIIGKNYPITAVANGVTQSFVAWINKIGATGKFAVINLFQITSGILLAGNGVTNIAALYKLDQKNKLVEDGAPYTALDKEKDMWVEAGFQLPHVEEKEVIENDDNGIGGFGSKLEDINPHDTKSIAKLIRAEIKRELPQYKISVKMDSGRSSAVRGSISKIPDDVRMYSDEYLKHTIENGNARFDQDEIYSAEMEKALDILKAIGNQYRYDKSDAMTDYFDTNFYWFTDIDWQYRDEREKEEIAAYSESEANDSEFDNELREKMLNAIYEKAHEDFKGKLEDGTKTILINRAGATALVALDDLTDDEIKKKLGDDKFDDFMYGSEWVGKLLRAIKPNGMVKSQKITLLKDSIEEADALEITGQAWDKLLTDLVESY